MFPTLFKTDIQKAQIAITRLYEARQTYYLQAVIDGTPDREREKEIESFNRRIEQAEERKTEIEIRDAMKEDIEENEGRGLIARMARAGAQFIERF